MTPKGARISEQGETASQGAARWFARHRSGTVTAQELRELEVWLAQDPRRRAAYDHLGLAAPAQARPPAADLFEE